MKKDYLNYKKALLTSLLLSTSLTLSGCSELSNIVKNNNLEVEEESSKYLVEFLNDKATIYNIATEKGNIEYNDEYVRVLTENYGIIDFNKENVVIFDSLEDANFFALSIVEDNYNIIYMDSMIENKSLNK